MKKLLHTLLIHLPTMLLILGGEALVGGVAMIYPPAGLIAAGALCITAGVILILGGYGNDAENNQTNDKTKQP